MVTPEVRPIPAAAPAADALRMVLFGLPGAGKSSLLGALGEAATTQEYLLRGRLNDLSHHLAPLQTRLYDDTPQRTTEEVVPYPIAFEPFDDDAEGPTNAVLLDCDGRVASELVQHADTLNNGGPVGKLAAEVVSADALILAVDCSAAPEQLEEEFDAFDRFLRDLEQGRSARVDVGGLPVFLVLTKCDLLAQPGDTTIDWMERIEQRKREVDAHFRAFLTRRAGERGTIPFGRLDLHVWATAVKRPALAGAPARPREPYGVAELFRQSLDHAAAYRRRCRQSSRRLFWTAWGSAVVAAMCVLVAIFLVVRPPPKPPSELQLTLEALQSAEKPTPAERLRASLGELHTRRDQLRTLQEDPGFAALPQRLRQYAVSRFNEVDAYLEWMDQLVAVPRPVTVNSEAELRDIKTQLEKLAPRIHAEWEDTEGVRLFRERLAEVNALLDGIHHVETLYLADPARARNLATFNGYRKDSGVNWRAWFTDLEALRGQLKPVTYKQTDSLPGTSGLNYAAVERFDAVGEARDVRQQLERERNLAAALGLIGPISDRPPVLAIEKPAAFSLSMAKERLETLQRQYPHYKEEFRRTNLPEAFRRDVAAAAEANYKALLEPAQERVLAQLQKADGDDKARWDALRDWLLGNPEELAAWRTLAVLIEHLYDPQAPDPVPALAAFLQETTFSLEARRITLELPDELQGRVPPTAELSIYHRNEKEPALVFEQTGKPDPRTAALTFELKKGKRIVYLPGDELWVTLPLPDGKQLTWARNRSMRFQFERLLREPRLHKVGENPTNGDLVTGIRVRIEPPDGWPRVPDLLPLVR